MFSAKHNRVFIVAEISGNHGMDLDKAFELVKIAKWAGADAVKLQTYTADTITLNSDAQDFKLLGSSPWSGYETFYNLYANAFTPWEWHAQIFDFCRANDIVPFSSAFDITAVDFLESLDCPMYKVASPEINHLPLIERIALTNKPVIFSLGMANRNLFEEALSTFRNISNSKVGVLQCETSYPAAPENANLSLISVLNDLYGVVPGYSDHTIGNECVIAAVALGAKIIEKHISIDKEEIDGFFSSTPEEFRSMVRAIRNVELALGLREFRDEIPSEGVVSLRSIYPAQEIKEGEIFTEDNLRIVRPGLSLSPKYLKETLGRVAKRNLGIGDRLFLDDIM